MARRAHGIAQVIVDGYDGDTASIWTTARSGETLYKQVSSLPGFATEKSQIFVALLAKRFEVKPRSWKADAGAFSDNQPRSAADVDSLPKLREVQAWKKAQKAAKRSKSWFSLSLRRTIGDRVTDEYAEVMRAAPAGRGSLTLQRRSDRQQLLLQTVERLLVDRSFRDLTVADVMAEAKLPRTAFYRAFPDLESILLLGIERVSAELGEATAIWLEDATDPIGSLRPSAVALIDVYRTHGRLLLAFAEAAASAPAVEAAWQASVNGFVALATDRIRALVASGDAALDHPEATATALVWMTERFLLESYGRGPAVPAATATEVLELIWHRTLFA